MSRNTIDEIFNNFEEDMSSANEDEKEEFLNRNINKALANLGGSANIYSIRDKKTGKLDPNLSVDAIEKLKFSAEKAYMQAYEKDDGHDLTRALWDVYQSLAEYGSANKITEENIGDLDVGTVSELDGIKEETPGISNFDVGGPALSKDRAQKITQQFANPEAAIVSDKELDERKEEIIESLADDKFKDSKKGTSKIKLNASILDETVTEDRDKLLDKVNQTDNKSPTTDKIVGKNEETVKTNPQTPKSKTLEDSIKFDDTELETPVAKKPVLDNKSPKLTTSRRKKDMYIPKNRPSTGNEFMDYINTITEKVLIDQLSISNYKKKILKKLKDDIKSKKDYKKLRQLVVNDLIDKNRDAYSKRNDLLDIAEAITKVEFGAQSGIYEANKKKGLIGSYLLNIVLAGAVAVTGYFGWGELKSAYKDAEKIVKEKLASAKEDLSGTIDDKIKTAKPDITKDVKESITKDTEYVEDIVNKTKESVKSDTKYAEDIVKKAKDGIKNDTEYANGIVNKAKEGVKGDIKTAKEALEGKLNTTDKNVGEVKKEVAGYKDKIAELKKENARLRRATDLKTYFSNKEMFVKIISRDLGYVISDGNNGKGWAEIMKSDDYFEKSYNKIKSDKTGEGPLYILFDTFLNKEKAAFVLGEKGYKGILAGDIYQPIINKIAKNNPEVGAEFYKKLETTWNSLIDLDNEKGDKHNLNIKIDYNKGKPKISLK